MKATQISPGRFHHFHLARQLVKFDKLDAIYTGYPKFKLRDEKGIPSKKIKTFPLFQGPMMAINRFKYGPLKSLSSHLAWSAWNSLDKYVQLRIRKPTILIALSGAGLHTGRRVQQFDGKFVCDRGSTHIQFQNEILKEEYTRWGMKWKGTDIRFIEKELEEYHIADKITVPSIFCINSFLNKGIPREKLIKIPYGARLERFFPTSSGPNDNEFNILFVGQVSFRKGFLDLLEAFNSFSHPKKKLTVIGSVDEDIKKKFSPKMLYNVEFLGILSNESLRNFYSKSHALVLPSIEEGLAMVMGEALACGCPVIATPNSGADDLYENRKEGFILPIRSPDLIVDALTELADVPSLRRSMSIAALERVSRIGGWDKYGQQWLELLENLSNLK